MLVSNAVFLVVVALALVTAAVPVFEGQQFTRFVRAVENGQLYELNTPSSGNGTTPDVNHMFMHIAHVHGSPYERGLAYGRLLKSEIKTMLNVEFPAFIFGVKGDDIVNSAMPKSLIDDLKGKTSYEVVLPFYRALAWVVQTQTPHNAKLYSRPANALAGLSAALCEEPTVPATIAGLPVPLAGTGTSTTDCVEKTLALVEGFNAFPELVRMGCSTLGSWRRGNVKAAPGLIQLRALDFGPGPWVNNQVLLVEHPSENEGFSFASLSFYGMMGVVTAVSDNVAQTEKIFLTHEGKQPGTYDGATLTFLIRHVLEQARNKEDAFHFLSEARRTWSVWLGFGDRVSKPSDDPMFVLGFRQNAVTRYSYTSLPSMTGQTMIQDVLYIDRHPQPSTDARMWTLLSEQIKMGGITADFMLQEIPAGTKTGDVHMQLYDENTESVFYALGLATEGGAYVPGGEAMHRPWVHYNITELLQHPNAVPSRQRLRIRY